MQSKRSYFNKTLFQKNLTRTWPLWGGLSIAGALVPLYSLLAMLGENLHPKPVEFAEILYRAVTEFGPIFLFLYAILCAALVWGYLYSPRSVGLMHTLPVDRTCLFVTNTLSGLTMMAVPFAVVGGLMTLLSLFQGFFHPIAVLITVMAVVCMAVLFFGIATFCAMLTGHLAALPVLYFLVNFLAPLLEGLVGILASGFLLGVYRVRMNTLQFLAPLLQIVSKFRASYLTETDIYRSMTSVVIEDRGQVLQLEGLGTVVLYGLAGVALLGAAWALYLRRKSECAGDVAAYRPLRPVFRFLAALLSALSLGMLLYQLLWDTLLERSLNAMFSLVPMIVFMALGGLVGYYIASMLLEKSLRVFRGSGRGVVIVCAGAMALCTVLKLDIFRMVDYIPDLEDIAAVEISTPYGGYFYYAADTEDGRQITEQMMDIHRAILEQKDSIAKLTWANYDRAISETNDRVQFSTDNITYILKDGHEINRQYTRMVFPEQIKDPETIDGKIAALCDSEIIRLDQVRIPENGTLFHAYVYHQGSEVLGNAQEDGSGASERLYEALLQDAKEGNIPSLYQEWWGIWTEAAEQRQRFDIEIEILYTMRRADSRDEYIESKSVVLYDGMEHTIAALIADGYFTENDFAMWRQEYERNLE